MELMHLLHRKTTEKLNWNLLKVIRRRYRVEAGSSGGKKSYRHDNHLNANLARKVGHQLPWLSRQGTLLHWWIRKNGTSLISRLRSANNPKLAQSRTSKLKANQTHLQVLNVAQFVAWTNREIWLRTKKTCTQTYLKNSHSLGWKKFTESGLLTSKIQHLRAKLDP